MPRDIVSDHRISLSWATLPIRAFCGRAGLSTLCYEYGFGAPAKKFRKRLGYGVWGLGFRV
jgi:hypothetical protein